jgi:hypothetical protein
MGKLAMVLTTGKHVRDVAEFSRLRLMRVEFDQTSVPGE